MEDIKLSTSIGILIVAILFIIIIASFQNKSNSEIINDKVHSVNGEVIDIEPKSMLSDTPFILNTKEMRIYKFTYTVKGEEKIGWYRSKVFDDDWIMDYKE